MDSSGEFDFNVELNGHSTDNTDKGEAHGVEENKAENTEVVGNPPSLDEPSDKGEVHGVEGNKTGNAEVAGNPPSLEEPSVLSPAASTQVTGSMQFDASDEESDSESEEEEDEHLDEEELKKEAEALRRELARATEDDDFEEVEIEMEITDEQPTISSTSMPTITEDETEEDQLVEEEETKKGGEVLPTDLVATTAEDTFEELQVELEMTNEEPVASRPTFTEDTVEKNQEQMAERNKALPNEARPITVDKPSSSGGRPRGDKKEDSPYTTPPRVSKPASNVPSLVAAMEQAVREVEQHLPALSPGIPSVGNSPANEQASEEVEGYGQGFGKDFEVPAPPAAPPASAAMDAGSQRTDDGEERPAADNEADAFFGLAYKKMGVPQKSNLPKGPAFADEREFERELSEEFNAKASTLNVLAKGDDEFEDDEFEGAGVPAININEIAQKAKEKAKAEELKVLDSLKKEIAVEKEKQTEERDNIKQERVEEAEEVLDPTEALLTVHNTYSQDMYDAGVLSPSYSNEEEEDSLVFSGIYMKDGEGAGPALQEEPLVNTSLKTRPLTDFVFKEEDEEEYEKLEQQQEELARMVEMERMQEQLAKEEEEKRLYSEWAAVEQLREEEHRQGPQEVIGVGGVVKTIDSSHISYRETLAYFQQLDMSADVGKIVPIELPRGIKTKVQTSIFKKNKLKFERATEKRDLVFLIAQQHYNPENHIHYRIIQTIYKKLTGADRCCPNIGSHWDILGFQGTNPQTDLNRSQGVLSLLQMLWLVEKHHAMALKLHGLSLQQPTDWPFACVAIGFTKDSVGTLRRAQIYAECNKQKAVLTIVNDMYLALFEQFYRMVKQAPATHHAEHLAEIRKIAETAPSKCLKEFYKRHQDSQVDPKQPSPDDILSTTTEF